MLNQINKKKKKKRYLWHCIKTPFLISRSFESRLKWLKVEEKEEEEERQLGPGQRSTVCHRIWISSGYVCHFPYPSPHLNSTRFWCARRHTSNAHKHKRKRRDMPLSPLYIQCSVHILFSTVHDFLNRRRTEEPTNDLLPPIFYILSLVIVVGLCVLYAKLFISLQKD